MRERDFERVQHKGGISPAWGLKYSDFAPYYDKAEKLFNVHGDRQKDPTEPLAEQDYPYPPVSQEPFMQGIVDKLSDMGFYPFHLPVGLKLNEVDRTLSECIRCDTCDGFPCLMGAKADAEVNCIRPTRQYDNVTLMTGAKVERLHTNAAGRSVTAVETVVNGDKQLFSANLVEESNINSGEIQALLDGLPEAEVRVTGMRPQQGVGIEFLDYIVPGTSRPFADDWRGYDLAIVQIQLIVNDIELAINTSNKAE